MRILLVEDHRELAETIAAGLRREGLAVDLAADGPAALDRAATFRYEVIVLDRNLPRMHGDEVCRTLISNGHPARILMLTASAGIEDRVDGLTCGADDYLPKPFAFAELVARIRALIRRNQPALTPVLSHAGLRLDPNLRTASRSGRRLDLRPKEFAVLEVLMAAAGRPVPAEELLERAWDEAADPFTHTVKVTVSRLRRKLGDPPLIHTVPQAGYRLAAA
ncbi:transcriptional regulatory protein CutR [Actinoplanes ianthinogenes]|uniref:Transcriptional regulatory protein CutR n=1 Tax=Actinoplanes ianthinogenes TaxID=122358 RepID=A0ABM7LKY0_9ACTN|nr:response regulator transcription factor [Actinoplanes ianthinogenes]BCJ39895.1 transcriptional regulatory protein CutR [Actinoplanes ianthinogenes]GGR08840.1 transcriptional regulatory protein CutR [Actinoplanes ianthinogenes]